MGGFVATRDDALAERLRFLQNSAGSVPSPFDCYMVLRGIKTLPVRMRQHAANAMAVARFLEASPRVAQVIYPGLPSHPQHELARRQCRGYSGMVSFRIKGTLENAKIFLKHLKVFTLAESLGAVESLAELPSVMTHASVPAEQRAALGITDTLIRLSVGIEDEADLIADLDQALCQAVPLDASQPTTTTTAAAAKSAPHDDAVQQARAHSRRMHESSLTFGDSAPQANAASGRGRVPPSGPSSQFF